ncbi:MAG: hypothetical protein ACJ72N_16250 [Labedaea sp.]
MPSYNIEAINDCMRRAQDYKPKFGEIADTFPEGGGNAAAYGELTSSAAVARAVDALNSAMHKEFTAAENTLDQVARSLDAVVRSVQNTEDNNVRSMTPEVRLL